MALPVTITGISTSVACLGPFKTTSAPLIKQIASNGSVALGDVTARTALGQSFTTGASAETITKVRLTLSKIGTPTDDVVANIYATDGSGLPTGASLGTGSIAAASITGADEGAEITFTPSVAASASTKYALALSRSGAINGSNYFVIPNHTTSQIANGDILINNGSVWAASTGDMRLVLCGATAFYFIGKDSGTANTIAIFKATDPTASWASVATSGTAALDPKALAAVQVGDVIHIALIVGATTSVSLYYKSFDMATDSILIGNELVHAAFNPQTNAAADVFGCSICMQGSQPTILYNGPQVSSMGSSYSQIYERHRTGVNTWSAGQQVSAGGQINVDRPEIIQGSSDRAHLFWKPTGTSTTTHTRSMNSSYTLQTALAPTGGSANADPPLCAISYDASGTQKIICRDYARNHYFNSADSPSITTTGSNIFTNSSFPLGLFNYSTEVWAMGRSTTDSDLYVVKSTDHGASWGSAISAFVGTVAGAGVNLSKDGNCYQRDLSVVIPYIVNDGGTLKYNEYTIATQVVDAWNVFDKSSSITLSNSDKTATDSTADDGGVRSTTAYSNTNGGKFYAEFKIDNFVSGNAPLVGLRSLSEDLTTGVNDTTYVQASGAMFSEGTLVGGAAPFSPFTDNDIMSLAWNTSTERLWYRQNAGNWKGAGAADGDPASGTNGLDISAYTDGQYALWALFTNTAEAVTVRTEAAEFTQTPPVGYLSWMGETLTQPKAPTPYKQAPRFIRRMR